ncbi:anthranilate phosphoribosyltransferase [Marinomonas sp. C2222]|uniref:Anthranilate phosphoribosyltransferase n=1 Tax=Marinomonas sargassi TaxID=2984494 RepID=A0ABT2YQU0_9GAMM|nr:anthranilate phosphoribosyltransferase [Marinomonas sargassi]MCV2402255.1 anthranilate phosphoribosyltransferase [Marinomonas sargassi]
MTELIENMLSGKLSDEEIAESIISLREKGETSDDIYNYVGCINKHAKPISTSEELLDVCGTGGSGLSRFNVSTASAFVISALGVPVIKHGNRGSRRPNGSFDLLEGLGIGIEQSPEQIKATIKQTNLGFVFAKHYHPSLKSVANGRKLAGGRSIFNLAGPLSNPAQITYQVIGTADQSKAEALAKACIKLGRKRAVVVYGEPGIDEVSISGVSHIYECSEGQIKYYKITPEEFGISPVKYDDIPGGYVEANKAIFIKLLNGSAEQSIIDMVAINSGIALYISGQSSSIKGGYDSAKACILSGKMKAQFNTYFSALEKV